MNNFSFSLSCTWMTIIDCLFYASDSLSWDVSWSKLLKISKILNFLKSDLITCSLPTKINNFKFQWSIVQLSLDKIKEAIRICLIQDFETDFLWKVSLRILNSGIILKTFTHTFHVNPLCWQIIKPYFILLMSSDANLKSWSVKLTTFSSFLICLFGLLLNGPESTAMVMSGWSVHLTTSFTGQAYISGLPVLCAHTFACNWQKPFLNQWQGGEWL